MALATTALLLAALAAGVETPSDSATGVVQGRIVEEDTAPIPYANVVIPGTRRGAQTDVHGEFTITKVPLGTHSLKFQCPGYRTQSRAFTVRDAAPLDVGTIVLLSMSSEPERPIVESFPPDLLKRFRRARVVRIATPATYPKSGFTRRVDGSPGVEWEQRFLALLADTTAYRTSPGRSRKLCIFRENVRVQLEDAAGLLDLKFSLGCSDLLVQGGERPEIRDFTALYLPFVELMLEALPGELRLLDARSEGIEQAAREAATGPGTKR